ncbi:hypothetical protein ACSDQ9_07100 [Aestuariimicrobium soli]|uniref:hypothetical protein n=1 Tax=Aestuariimicrobium soli TaxID=2035834 RepID=UPI003EB7B232
MTEADASGDRDDLVPEFVPPLIAVLTAVERDKGAPLTLDEVIEVRDHATCIKSPKRLAEQMAEQRGYADLDPENVWDEWQAWLTVRDQS